MPIEFRCTQCDKLLRTPDETAGQQAKCPACGAIVTVPELATASPFGATTQAAAAAPFSENPFASPAGPLAEGPSAASRVSGPAIGLMITGGLGALMSLLAVAVALMRGVAVAPGARPHWDVSPATIVVLQLVQIGVGVVILLGGISMRRLEGYGWAMTGSILAMIPCISPCCLLGLPFGIWALVVLSNNEVKDAFSTTVR